MKCNFLIHIPKLITFGTHNLHTFKHNTLINELLLMQFYLFNIRPKSHHWKWRKLRVTLPVNMAPFSKEDKILIKCLYEYKGYNAGQFITEFPDKCWRKNCINRLLWSSESLEQSTGVRAAADDAVHALFSVCSLRDDNVITDKPTWKLKHTNSILEYFEYFCQMSSKSILTTLSYTASKLVRFLRHSVLYSA